MARFAQILAERKMTLVVSLPMNSIDMARVAVEYGAHALKIHVNVHHRASGNRFGSLIEEMDSIQDILATVNVPLGLVPGGADAFISQDEFRVIEEWGVDFFSVYAQHMPLFLSEKTKLTRMIAIDHAITPLELQGISTAPIDVLEASIIPNEAYGFPLNFADLIKYAGIVKSVNKPVLVPTQKAIKPTEVKNLSFIGVKAIMIGAVVTGQDLECLKQVTAQFSEEICKL